MDTAAVGSGHILLATLACRKNWKKNHATSIDGLAKWRNISPICTSWLRHGEFTLNLPVKILSYLTSLVSSAWLRRDLVDSQGDQIGILIRPLEIPHFLNLVLFSRHTIVYLVIFLQVWCFFCHNHIHSAATLVKVIQFKLFIDWGKSILTLGESAIWLLDGRPCLLRVVGTFAWPPSTSTASLTPADATTWTGSRSSSGWESVLRHNGTWNRDTKKRLKFFKTWSEHN